ncbi:MAG: hypothetical protein GXO25_04215 [Euryarchaeota archaeon]|nr:hypothetical protein [Euryarchaeota archaeon]
MIEGVLIFGILAAIFVFLYFKQGFTQALVVTSVITGIGILLLPDYVITSFYLRIGGRWHLIIIDMTMLKILLLVLLAFVYIFRKDLEKALKGVVNNGAR